MRDARRILIVMETPRRPNPYEVWLLIAMLLSSTASLLHVAPNPNSIVNILPEPSRFFWNLQLAIGSALALFGMWLIRTRFRIKFLSNQQATARIFKIAGHLWTGSGALVYCCVIFYYAGLQALMPGLTVGSVAVAALFRTLQLRGQVRHMLQKVGERDDTNSNLSLVDGGE